MPNYQHDAPETLNNEMKVISTNFKVTRAKIFKNHQQQHLEQFQNQPLNSDYSRNRQFLDIDMFSEQMLHIWQGPLMKQELLKPINIDEEGPSSLTNVTHSFNDPLTNRIDDLQHTFVLSNNLF